MTLTLVAAVLKGGVVVVDVGDEDGELAHADERLPRPVGGSDRQSVLPLPLPVETLRGADDSCKHRHCLFCKSQPRG